MQFGIAIPQFVHDNAFDPTSLRAYLRRAEQMGFHSAWTLERVLGGPSTLAPLETMAFAAACTERLRIGSAALISPLHNPVHLAKSVATLDQLSQGRIDLGIATGGPWRMFSAFEVEPSSYVARFTEGLQLMQALWTSDSVTHDGRFWQLRDAVLEPKPVQQPLPVWFGANAPGALRRAVRHGYGFMGAGSTTTARFTEQVALIRSTANGGKLRIGKRVYICVDEDVDRARSRMTSALEAMYAAFGLPNIIDVAVYGSPAQCIAGLEAVKAAGAEVIVLDALFDEPEQLERLASEVVPHVR
jgi:probable F420-dependent oxidoreductase